MLYLPKGTSTKDQHLKTQMTISLNDDDSKKSETIWKKMGFLKNKEQI